MQKKWTGERLQTNIFADVAVEHLHRYALAEMFTKDMVVLDIASGEGYGSYILSKKSNKLFGVDIDEKAVKHAHQKYVSSNLEFKIGSADKIPLEDSSIDVLTSFETIEHHDKHIEMFKEIIRVLKPDGILIMSSPDKKYHSDLQSKNNPFHIKELYLDEFENLVKSFFKKYDTYLQKCINSTSLIAKKDVFTKTLLFDGNYDGIFKKELIPLYNIIIATNNDFLKEIDLFMFDGEIIIKQLNENNLNYIRNSTSFRIGNIVLRPFIIIKKIFKSFSFNRNE